MNHNPEELLISVIPIHQQQQCRYRKQGILLVTSAKTISFVHKNFILSKDNTIEGNNQNIHKRIVNNIVVFVLHTSQKYPMKSCSTCETYKDFLKPQKLPYS